MAILATIGLATSILKATGLGEKIGNWIGGDTGEQAAKKILDTAQEVTNATSPETAAEVISKDPKLAAELKQALISQETEIVKLHLADVQDARAMQMQAMTSDDKFVRRFVHYLAACWSVAAISYIFAISFLTVPEDSLRFVDTVLGFILGTIIAQILNFFFGSSKGSSDKTAMIKDQMNQMMRK